MISNAAAKLQYTDIYAEESSVSGLDTFLTIKDVLHHVGIGKTTVYKLMKAGYFPKSFQIKGTTTVVWSFADIKQWMEQQKQEQQK